MDLNASCLDNSPSDGGIDAFSPLCKARRGFCKNVSCFCTSTCGGKL